VLGLARFHIGFSIVGAERHDEYYKGMDISFPTEDFSMVLLILFLSVLHGNFLLI
jgi:hypothetical protein